MKNVLFNLRQDLEERYVMCKSENEILQKKLAARSESVDEIKDTEPKSDKKKDDSDLSDMFETGTSSSKKSRNSLETLDIINLSDFEVKTNVSLKIYDLCNTSFIVSFFFKFLHRLLHGISVGRISRSRINIFFV